ncbi:ABC transporter permease [Cupriavidus necator]
MTVVAPDVVGALLQSAVMAALPLMTAGLGELVSERAGVLNLGVEGTMLAGAATGFVVVAATNNLWLGMLAGMAVGLVLSAIFGLCTLTLYTSQIPTGMAITAFGMGLSAYVGKSVPAQPIQSTTTVHIPFVSDLPVLGKALFSLPVFAYIAFALCAATWWLVNKSRAGLKLRSVGDSPVVAHQLGFAVTKIRYGAVLFGGAMSGLAGAYYCAGYVLLWQENMVAGRGWMAIALVMFAGWRPVRLALGAILFGAITAAQFQAQTLGIEVPSQLLTAFPYIATIAVLTYISSRKNSALDLPKSLGRTFHPLISKLV